METYEFYQWYCEPVCVVRAPTGTPIRDLLVMAREWSLGQRLDYFILRSGHERFLRFCDRCKEALGGDENWALRLERSRRPGQLTLPDLNDMLHGITREIPSKWKEYPYVC